MVVIGEGVTHIGKCAFYSGIDAYCSLTTVYISGTVTSIGDFAFYGAHELNRISISAGTNSLSVGEDAFGGCRSVTDIFCYSGPFGSWGSADMDFSNSENRKPALHVKSELYSAWNTKYGGNKSLVNIQDDLNEYAGYDMAEPISVEWNNEDKILTVKMKVKELPGNFVRYWTGWESYYEDVERVNIEMLNGVELTSIGEAAFKGMKNLKFFQIPLSVQHIGYEAFYDCEKLETIGVFQHLLSADLISIGARAFSGCTALNEIFISNRVRHIGNGAFSSCANLETVGFLREKTNKNPITFGPNVLAYCSKLSSILYMPEEVAIIPSGMFSYCTSLENFTCPGDVVRIARSAFEGCSNLKYVKLNDKLETIDVNAFLNCSSLRSDDASTTALTIPASVKVIGSKDAQYSSGAFKGCNVVRELNLKPNPTTLQWYGYDYDFNRSITLDCHADNLSNLLTLGQNYRNKLYAEFNMTVNAATTSEGKCWSTLYCPPIENNDRLALSAIYEDGHEMDFTPVIYVAKVMGNSVALKNTNSQYVPQGQAVILSGASSYLADSDAKFVLTYRKSSSELDEGDTSDNQLLGSAAAVELEDGYAYYALAKYKVDDTDAYNVQFQRVSPSIRIPAHKAFIRLPQTSSVKELGLSLIDEDADGIVQIQNSKFKIQNENDDAWYDLSGRRISAEANSSLFTLHSSLKKGIYINNGHKFIVK